MKQISASTRKEYERIFNRFEESGKSTTDFLKSFSSPNSFRKAENALKEFGALERAKIKEDIIIQSNSELHKFKSGLESNSTKLGIDSKSGQNLNRNIFELKDKVEKAFTQQLGQSFSDGQNIKAYAKIKIINANGTERWINTGFKRGSVEELVAFFTASVGEYAAQYEIKSIDVETYEFD